MENIEEELESFGIEAVAALTEPVHSFDEVFGEYTRRHETTRRRKRYTMGVAVAGLAIAVLVVSSYAISGFGNYAERVRTAGSSSNLYATVNGTPVTMKQWNVTKELKLLAAKENHQPHPSVKSIQTYLFTQLVEYQEAQKEHLVPSLAYAREYAQKMELFMEHPPKNTPKADLAEERRLMRINLKVQGMSNQTYWNVAAPKAYQMGLAIGKLREKYITQYSAKLASTPNATASQHAFAEYGAQLLKQAKIVIYRK